MTKRNQNGYDYQTELNADCITNLQDFAAIAAEWLDDYTLTGPVAQ
jgi:hypothetical protein